MSNIARRGWCTSASIVAGILCIVAIAGEAVVCHAIEPRYAGVAASTTDVPLTLLGSFGPACGADGHDVVWNGTGLRNSGGRARLRLNIPGQPVAAYLYLVGSDDPTRGGRRLPNGDNTVRAVIRSAAGRAVRNVPLAHQALDVFVNKLDITAEVAPGPNVIRISGYGLNDPEGFFVVAVYTAPGLPAVRVDLFDGADFGYYPMAPPFGPDGEVVASVYPAAGIPRDGRVWMALGGMQPRRGDEILVRTGAGAPDVAALPDTDGDGLPDLLQRQFRLARRDRRPLGNDPADRAGNLEALPGSISLEEDKLGVRRGGYGRGAELDLFARDFTLPAGDEYAAFQVQSEDPEFGDSFTLVMAATRMPEECGNPEPDFIVTKSASIDEGFPGDLVTYTFVVTNTGLEPLENIVVTDSVLGYIGTVAALGLAESATLTYVDYRLPACAASAFTVETRCDGVTVVEDRCSLPNTVTAAWNDLVRTAEDCVEIRKRPDFTVTKSASVDEGFPGDLVTYTFTVTNTGEIPLVDIDVTDDVLGPIGTITLGVGESGTLTYVDYALPVCEASAFTVETRCDGVTVVEDRCSLPNTVTATWGALMRTAEDCVEIRKRGRIIVVKRTVPAGAEGVFPFAASYDADGFSLSDGQRNDSGALDPGIYAVSEQVPAGWTLQSVECRNATGAVENPQAIDLQPYETVTCVFTNERLTPGIEILKAVDPTEGYPGDVVTYSFTVRNTGGLTLHDVTVSDPTLSPGPLAVIPELAPGASETFTREMTVPSCSDPRTEPGACTDGSSECAGGPAAPFGGDAFSRILRDWNPPVPQLCHLPNTATAVGESAGGTVVTDDDDACLTILPFKLIGDLVWYDADQDGVRDAGEPGVPDMLVLLTLPNGDRVPFLTEAGGWYRMGGIRHGDYLVAPLVRAPGGVVTTGNAPLPVRLEKCDLAYLDADFGFWEPDQPGQ